MSEDEWPVTLSPHDCGLLVAGLRAFLAAFDRHRQEDGGASHPESEWEELQANVRRLQLKLTAVMQDHPPRPPR